MRRQFLRARAAIRDTIKPASDAVIGATAVGVLRATRYFDPDKTADVFASIIKTIGPLLREHKIGRANLTAAFPEKTPEEIDRILMGVWDNLGRVAAEFAHLDHIWDLHPDNTESGRIEA